MKFDINQKDFPSTTHKSIWHAAVFMAQFCEVIPPQFTGKEAVDLREGEKSLYDFMTDLYSDMYERPERYYIPVGEYDSFMNGRNNKKLSDKDEKQESKLRNKFQKAIQFYQKLLFDIGAKSEPELSSYNLIADKSVLTGVFKNHNLRIMQNGMEKRIAALSNIGIEINYSKDKIIVSNNKYPKMLIALSALCKANNRKFAVTNFLRCDFRGLINSHKPGFDDAVSILPEKLKKLALDMDAYMQQNIDCKISVEPLKNTTLHSEWKLFYKLKGKAIYSFHSDTGGFKTFAYFNHHDNVSRMGYLLKEDSESLYAWFYDRVPTSICSCKNNRLVDIGGQEKRICGLMNRIDVADPDEYNLMNLKHVIKLYLDKVHSLN